MPSTVAVDTWRLEEWEREHSATRKSAGADADPFSVHAAALSDGVDPLDGWPARSLNDALTDLGPAQPHVRLVVEPWSRAALPDDHDDWADGIDPQDAANGDASGQAEAPFIPPPPRPTVSRQPLPFAFAEEPRPPVVGDLSDTKLAEFDAAGVELVHALAAADPVQLQGSIESAPGPATYFDDMLGPAPMIIERARAEQQLGVLPALPAVPRPNPLHGLAIGFSLSLVTGAGLYMLLAGG